MIGSLPVFIGLAHFLILSHIACNHQVVASVQLGNITKVGVIFFPPSRLWDSILSAAKRMCKMLTCSSGFLQFESSGGLFVHSEDLQ